MEAKIYTTMTRVGAGSLAVGIVVLLTGVAAGILMILNGGILLRRKNEITI